MTSTIMSDTTKMIETGETRMEFTIDPEQGAAALFVGCQLKGKRLVRMERNNDKVVCYYVDENE